MTNFNADRARNPDRLRGMPITAHGSTWLLADYIPVFEPVWDRLYDSGVIRECYDHPDTNSAAIRLLVANYDLAPGEAASIILAASRAELVAAVERALYGEKKSHRTYTEWIELSLLANGIDIAKVPPEKVTYLMDYLESAGRTIPAHEFISSVGAVSFRARAGA